ncbi:uncharacterized protein LOC104416603 [Eucalyptus grandis]|uniref:uncharacterized protein LOC104416603 n=1 Tax=Eucalyptus grandis TaxID=71139 RepID=UPI00192EC68C|nr:uncharacterized protein LOC104416603 [Eucalyptus grandis]
MEHQVDTAADASISTSPIALPPLPHMSYAKPFPDISKIEVFNGNNFIRWQERVFSILDVHGVAFALTEVEPIDNKLRDQWIHTNKVCRHTIISTLSNELFDVYCLYKEAKQIWDSMTAKYTAKDVGRQKFVIGNYYRWEMSDDKEIKTQINKYHKLVKDLKAENINLQEEFLAGLLIKKLPESWNNYKQQLKHKDKQLSLADLIVHIIIEDKTRKEIKNRYYNKKNLITNPRLLTPPSKRKALALFVENQANIVANVKEWVVDSGAIRHICANKNAFSSYMPVGEGEKIIYLDDSRTAQVLGKGKVLLKLTFGKTLVLNDVLHVPNIRANLVSVALLGKVGVKVSFKSDKIVMTKNNVFVKKGYCNQ